MSERLLVVCTLLAALAATTQPAHAASSKRGRVTYVTSTTAFLDVGAADGVALGAVLQLWRRRGKPSSCEVTAVATHQASCKGDRVLVGDRVGLKALVAPAKAPVAPRAPLPDAALIAKQRQLLDAAPAPRVAFHKPRGSSGPSWGTRGVLGVRQQAWATLGAEDATFTRTVINGAVRIDLGLVPGLSAAGALRLVADELAPARARFRPQDPAELYVWEAALALDDGRSPVLARVGRFLPRKAPGATLLDGAQAGLRLAGGFIELSAYAGAIPDLMTLSPSLDRLTAGVTFAFDTPLGADVLVLPRARVALLSTPDLSTLRAEAEAQTQLLWGRALAAGASVRAGLDAQTAALSLDAARADLHLHPVETLQLSAGYRYLAPLAHDFDATPLILPALGAHHADVSAFWSTAPWLVLGTRSGLAADAAYGTVRGWAGPELRLPRLLGDLGGLGVGYAEELGDLAGRSGFVQADFSPFSVLTLWTRVAYLESAVPAGDALREGALFAGLMAPLLPWLALHGRGYALLALPTLNGSPRATPTVLAADGGIALSW